MKILGYIFAFILALLGFLFIALSSELNERSNDPYDATIYGMVFIIWGLLLKGYISRNYKGGAASIIGAILTGFGIFSVSSLPTLHSQISSTETFGSYTATALLLIGGVTLLYQGHRIHKSKETYNK